MPHNAPLSAAVPILGIVAYSSGTGKTTLLKALLTEFKARGWRVGVIKHSHHDFEVDIPGKDSYELRKAGAAKMLIASPYRWALMADIDNTQIEPDLATLLKELNQQDLDFILIEGMRGLPFPKIEVHRPSLRQPALFPQDPTIIALASDALVMEAGNLAQLDLNQHQQIADFILYSLKIEKR